MISFYYITMAKTDIISTNNLRGVPEGEFSQECLSNTNKSSINVRHILIHFKVIHRLDYTKSRLHEIP